MTIFSEQAFYARNATLMRKMASVSMERTAHIATSSLMFEVIVCYVVFYVLVSAINQNNSDIPPCNHNERYFPRFPRKTWLFRYYYFFFSFPRLDELALYVNKNQFCIPVHCIDTINDRLGYTDSNHVYFFISIHKSNIIHVWTCRMVSGDIVVFVWDEGESDSQGW